MPPTSSGLVSRRTEDDFFALLGPVFGVWAREDDLADRGAGNGVDAGAEDARFQRLLVDLGVDDRVEEALDVFGLDAHDGFFFGDQFLVGHVHGHLECGGGSALAGARLEHVELAVFDGELHVLHVAIVFLKFYSNFFELAVDLGHDALHLGEVHRRADAGDDVFALGVDEVVAVEDLLAGAGVAREADAGAGIVAGVAEDHLHDVDGGAEEAGDFLHAAVGDGFFRHPGAEHGADGAPELLDGIFGEVLAGLLLGRLACIRRRALSSRWRGRRCLLSRRGGASSRAGGASRSSLGSSITTLEYIWTKRR